MGDLYFYDFNFNLLHILSRTESINYSVFYNKVGTAEVHGELAGKLIRMCDGDFFAVQRVGNVEIQWMFTGVKFADGEIMLFGRTLNHLLTKRAVIPFATVKTDAQTLVRQLVADAYMTDRTQLSLSDGRVIDIADSDGVKYTLTKQDNFELSEPLADVFTASNYRRDVGHKLSDVVIEYLDYIDCGHELYADSVNKKWVFKIYKGTERKVILSEVNRNCTGIERTVEKQELYTCGFFEKHEEAASDSEEAEETKEKASEWYYVPGKEAEIPILRFEGILSGSESADAEVSLKTKQIKKTLKTEIQKLVFGKDYMLGDVFKVEYKLGGIDYTARIRVIGVNISIEKKILTIIPELEEIE